MSITFMAKYDQREGNSCHIHFSLADEQGPLFTASAGAVRVLPRRAAGGLRELTLLLAPNVNSYKRYAAGQLRADRGRLGARQPHVLAARGRARALAALREPRRRRGPESLHGAQRDHRRGPARRRSGPRARAGVRGQRLQRAGAAALPARCATRASCSPRARSRAAFGEEVVDHYVNAADVELAAFGAAVTDWERYRGSSDCEHGSRRTMAGAPVAALAASTPPRCSRPCAPDRLRGDRRAAGHGDQARAARARLAAARRARAVRALGIARSTLRQALTALTQSGHVFATRGRGGGTFVADPQPPRRSAVGEMLSQWRRPATSAWRSSWAWPCSPPSAPSARRSMRSTSSSRRSRTLGDFPPTARPTSACTSGSRKHRLDAPRAGDDRHAGRDDRPDLLHRRTRRRCCGPPPTPSTAAAGGRARKRDAMRAARAMPSICRAPSTSSRGFFRAARLGCPVAVARLASLPLTVRDRDYCH
jgi:hypothetical protein